MKLSSDFNPFLRIQLSCLFFLFPVTILPQNYSFLNRVLSSQITIDEKNHKIDSIITLLKAQQEDSLPYIYHQVAFWNYRNYNVPIAVEYEQKALQLMKFNTRNDSAFIQMSMTYLGVYYAKNNQMLASIDCLREVISMNFESSFLINAYIELGNSYFEIGDYFNAIKYLTYSGDLIERKQASKKLLRLSWYNLSLDYEHLDSKFSYLQALKYAHLVDSIDPILKTDSSKVYDAKLRLGALYGRDEIRDFNRAFFYLNQAEKLAFQLNDSLKINDVYYQKGGILNEIDQEQSLIYLYKALDFAPRWDSLTINYTYHELGKAYGLKHEYQRSIDQLLKGLTYVLEGEPLDLYLTNSPILIHSEYKDRILFGSIQLAESYLRYFESTSKPFYLEKSQAYFKLADHTINLIKQNSRAYRSKLFWRKLSTDIYGKAIRACYLAGKPEQAFFFMEKNKALLLSEDKSELSYRQSLELPREFLEEEEALNKQLVQIELLLESPQNLTSHEVDSLKKDHIDLTIQLQTLQDTVIGTDKVELLHLTGH